MVACAFSWDFKLQIAPTISFSDELHPPSVDSHAVQRVDTAKNLRALLGPVVAEAAQEQQRAANQAVEASALPPGFATTSEPRHSQLGPRMRGCSPGLGGSGVSLDPARHQFLFPALQVIKATRGVRQFLFSFSYAQEAQKMEDALEQLRCQRLRITPYALAQGVRKRRPRCQRQMPERGSETREMEKLHQRTTILKSCLSLVVAKIPARAPSNKDLHSNATWNDSGESFNACAGATVSIGRDVLSIFNAVRLVGSILCAHGCAVFFWTLSLDQRSTLENLVWPQEC